MLKIYGSDLSFPSNKVRFVANALGLQYEYIKVNLRAGEQKTAEFLKMNPVGKIPAINDDGFSLFESNAIIKYLASKAKSNLYPADLKQRAVIDAWMDFISLHIGAAVGRVMYNRVFYKMRGEEQDIRSLQDGIKFLSQFLPIINEQLKSNKYVAGNQISLADLSLLATIDPSEIGEIDLKPYSKLLEWRNALKKEAFYTKCYKSYEDTFMAMMK